MRRDIFAVLAVFSILLLSGGIVFGVGGDMGGPSQNGSTDFPYLIEDFNDFQAFCADPNYWASGVYTRLDCDLDFSIAGTYTRAPIAGDTDNTNHSFDGTAYAGNFDGNKHTITDLIIAGDDYLGLFGKTSSGAEVKNLGLENISVTGDRYIGGLVGENWYSNIINCYSKGEASSGWNNSYIGGLVGYSYDGNISNSYSSVTVSGDNGVGGLVGSNSGNISNCYSTGMVSGDSDVGGLVGDNGFGGIIINSFWDKETSGQLTSDGGESKTTAQMKDSSTFVGFNDCSWTIDQNNDYPRLAWENTTGLPITTNYPNVTYSGSGTENNPFILSNAEDLLSMSRRVVDWNCYFTMSNDIDMTGAVYVPVVKFSGNFDGGGYVISNLSIDSQVIGNRNQIALFGKITGTVSNLGLEIISVSGDSDVACLAGTNSGIIDNCYSTGTVTSSGSGVGGLAGVNGGTISSCYSTATIKSSSVGAGGLAGGNGGTISNCYSTGAVTGGGMSVGGLIGDNYYGSASNCYSTGDVKGLAFMGFSTGGLLGENYYGTINSCYSTGNVTSSGYSYEATGGLVGKNYSGSIINCYSTGMASGDVGVGGLVGLNEKGSINNCYSTGIPSGNKYVSGIGFNSEGSISNCFWDVETSGTTIGYFLNLSRPGTIVNVIGKTTEEMQTQSTFAGAPASWDFVGESANGSEDVWRMCVDWVSYPKFGWEFARSGDIACGDGIGLDDLAVLTDNWLSDDQYLNFYGLADINFDGVINLQDFAVMADSWLVGI